MSAGKPQLPPELLARFQELGLDLDEFLPALLSPPSQVFRINTLKAEPAEVLSSLSALDPRPVGWNRLVYRVGREKEVKLGNTLEHFLGLIYVQDASSTIPVTVLDPRPGEEILDMAASPGSKSTQIAAAMENTGLLVANDVSAKRIPALSGNLDRAGVLNSVVTQIAGQSYGHIAKQHFDRVLADAPCSSEGTLCRSFRLLEMWSEAGIGRLSAAQSNLALSAYYTLKPGGVMVYSTCTFAPEENEGVITNLLAKFPEAVVEPISIKGVRPAEPLTRWRGSTFNPQTKNILRLYPHQNDGEGFCIARIRKPGR